MNSIYQNELKYCMICGTRIIPGAKFCSNCGQKFDFMDMNESIVSNKKYANLQIGDFTTFGTYTLNYNPEPIEWQVLDIREKKALLISKFGIDAKPYNSSESDITWEYCSLRGWLNGEFYNNSFNNFEKDIIIKTENNNFSRGIFGSMKEISPTEDYVFILSPDEASYYFKNNNSKIFEHGYCVATPWATNHGARVYKVPLFHEYYSVWWLRSPGEYGNNFAAIFDVNRIERKGRMVNIQYYTVRPTIWISCE